MTETTTQDQSPPRDHAAPDSYAIHVTADRINVWQYRVTVAEQDGAWNHVERLDRPKDPRLSLEYAELKAPTADGYWLYSRTYDCTLECD